ncbi:MAG: hypothetical protein PVH41_01585 [Anaerolineae bacterium]|jgi:hypothetical protein
MNDTQHTQMDQLLDLLAEEVAKRLTARPRSPGTPTPQDRLAYEGLEGPQAPEIPPDRKPATMPARPEDETSAEPKSGRPTIEPAPMPESPDRPPLPSHTARLLGRLALGLLAVLVVINIPINRHGTTLATAMPDRRALVIRDGLVVKEAGEPEIYVYQDGRFRWISSLTAFERRGYTWEDVHIVDDGFLEDYETGPPIHVILKCHESPHIYRLEGDEKRWIVDIEAFQAEGYVWEDVEFVVCSYLRNLRDGETIPPGQGPPPEP